MRTCLVLAGAIALVSALSRPAFAQTDDAHARDGLARYDEGLALHAAGREEDAYVKFAEAYAVLKTPPVLFNLARSEQLTGRLLDAAAHFKEYVRAPESPKVSERWREKASRYLDEVQAQLGHLRIAAENGARVTVDGRPVDVPVAAPLDVLPGEHAIEAREGAQVKERTVHAGANEVVDVDVRFDAAPPSVVEAPPVAVPPPPAAAVPPRISSEPRGASTGTAKYVVVASLGGVALAAVATGIGFEIAANGDAATARRLSAQIPAGSSSCVASSSLCTQRNDANHRAQDDRNVAVGAFVAGAVAGASAVLALLLWPRAPSKKTSSSWPVILPAASPTFAGLVLEGNFR